MIRKANLKQEGFKVMGEIIIPQGYKSALNLHDTQVAIKTVKDYFQPELRQVIYGTFQHQLQQLYVFRL